MSKTTDPGHCTIPTCDARCVFEGDIYGPCDGVVMIRDSGFAGDEWWQVHLCEKHEKTWDGNG